MKKLLLIVLFSPIFISLYAQSSQDYFAKDAILANAVLETKNSGYTDSHGYINFDNQIGSSAAWNVFMASADSQTITIRYANASSLNRFMFMTVDSAQNLKIDFPPTSSWTQWEVVSVKVSLKEGLNRVQFESGMNEGGPNLDFINVTGEPGTIQYSLNINSTGGEILLNPSGGLYDANTQVQIEALPFENYEFIEWSGDFLSKDNPASVTMNSNKSITAVYDFVFDTTITEFENTPVGFASLNGGTNGGEGGEVVIIKDAQSFFDLMHARENKIFTPLIVYIDSAIVGFDDMIDIKRTSNISVLGLGQNAVIQGFGIKVVESNNIVIRNIKFADAKVDEKDALTIDESYNIWIDHCTFTDSPSVDPDRNNHDGLLDIKRGSYNVTVSNCYFTNHRTVALLGHSVKETNDVNLKVTYYRNWFDGTNSRNPRVRYGKAHVLNNLYTNITAYGIGVTCGCSVMVEGNFFENTQIPVLISQVNDPGETLSGDPVGYAKASGNFILNSGTIAENLDLFDFTPSDYYEYTVDSGYTVKSIVQKLAGAGKLNITTSAKEESDSKPLEFELSQNFPNPFNPVTQIKYSINKASHVSLDIYDVLGNIVIHAADGFHQIGNYSKNIDMRDFSSGVYIYRLQSENKILSRKMLLLK